MEREKKKYNMLEMVGSGLLLYFSAHPTDFFFSLIPKRTFYFEIFNNLGKTLAEGNPHIVVNIR